MNATAGRLFSAMAAVALAAPAAGFAQSSVTITGRIHISVDNLKFSQPAATRTTTSESRLNDESSDLWIRVREDLGGGLSAFAQLGLKPNIDSSALSSAGESFVGLSSKTTGEIRAGRNNFHWYKAPWDGYALGGARDHAPASLIDLAGAGAVPIANATRTPNSIKWISPRWGGFGIDAGYSFNPGGATVSEADLTAGNTARKGRGFNFNPSFSGANWQIAWSYWNGKADAPAAATAAAQLAGADQRSDSLYGYYAWGGLKIGAIWNKTKLKASATGGALAPVGTELSNRTAWSIPVRYTTGSHHFIAHYTKARDDKATPGVQDGAKMWSLMYAYGLSKRTYVSVAYGKLTNDAGAAYSLFDNSTTSIGSVNSASAAGEDPRITSFGILHTF